MSTGIIIAISIIGLSLLTVIVVGFMSYKKMKPTIKNFKNLNTKIQQEIQFYNRESQHLNNRVKELSLEASKIQQEAAVKSIYIQDFTDRQGELQSSLRYLQEHAGEYSKGIARNVKNEVQEDGPKMMEVFKRAVKKTAQKQKHRFKSKEESRGVL